MQKPRDLTIADLERWADTFARAVTAMALAGLIAAAISAASHIIIQSPQWQTLQSKSEEAQ